MEFPMLELLISISILGGIATVLAVIMVIADATIGDYGEKTLTINNGDSYTVDGG